MAAVNKQVLDIHSLGGVIPPGRVTQFLRAAGRDPVRALALHDWNEAVGGAFYSPLQKAELALRVKVESAMAAAYGATWFADPAFLGVNDWAVHAEITSASRRLMTDGAPVDADGLMAKASFGLWVGLLRPIFNPPVWMTRLRTAFPALPVGEGRHELAGLAARAAFLRNRIDHHEPLIALDVSALHTDLMTLLRWIDPALAARAKAGCTVQQLLRAKP